MRKARSSKQRNKGGRPPTRVEEVPHYTASLDAAVPSERIIAVCYDADSDKWVAIHSNKADRYVIGIGNTEPLARRIAGLKALQEKQNHVNERRASKEAALTSLLETLARLAEAIEENNEYRTLDPVDQEIRLVEVRSGTHLLQKAKTLSVPAVVALAATLVYLSTKFADAVIGRLADAAVIHLEKYLGL